MATSALHVLTGWPRRAAAALCLVMAVATAMSGRHAQAARPDTAPVPAGLVATTAVVSADAATFVHVGDRIDLVAPEAESGIATGDSATASIVASGVQVLAVHPATTSLTGSSAVQLLVAARRDVAVQIAADQSTQVLAAITVPP